MGAKILQNDKYVKRIESKENEKIKMFKKISHSRKYREINKAFAIEGLRLCLDAAASETKILKTFYTEVAYKKFYSKINEIIKASGESYLITEAMSKKISETLSPQGIFCIISIDEQKNDLNPFFEKTIMLENIQDPGNLGTILRSADAFGIKNVILSSDCADVYSPKVIRGSMGAIFRLNFIFSKDLVSFIKKHKLTCYATVPDRSAEKITDIEFVKGVILVIGNEGRGISSSLLNVCKKKITIPMNGTAESLNAAVAASIAMWEIMK